MTIDQSVPKIERKRVPSHQPVRPIKTKAIGGWLYLYAYIIFKFIAAGILPLIKIGYVLFENAVWTNSITSSSHLYHPIYLPGLTLEIFYYLTLVFFSIISAYLFIKKIKTFPKFFSYLLYSLILIIIFTVTSLKLDPESENFLMEGVFIAVIQSIIVTALILYLKKSNRVKLTFTEDLSPSLRNCYKFIYSPIIVICLLSIWVLITSYG